MVMLVLFYNQGDRRTCNDGPLSKCILIRIESTGFFLRNKIAAKPFPKPQLKVHDFPKKTVK